MWSMRPWPGIRSMTGTDAVKVLASTHFVFPMPVVCGEGEYVDVQTRMMRVTPRMPRSGLAPGVAALLPDGPLDREVTVGVAMIVQLRPATWRRRLALWLRDVAMWIEYPRSKTLSR